MKNQPEPTDIPGSQLLFCGNLERPGLAVNYRPYVDFSRRETTGDQARIEALLAEWNLEGKRILHIGIGNSGLALRFGQRGAIIDGVTVSEEERAHAQALNIANYKVHVVNKYSRECVAAFKRDEFDFIVDNNLASFACCQYHLYSMFDNYLWSLKPGGKILTDQRGMDWALSDPSFILNFAGLTRLVGNLPINVIKMTSMVYALELQESAQTNSKKLCVHALRRERESTYIESFEPGSDNE